MKIKWHDGFSVKVKAGNGEVCISANREGLLSLAKQLSEMAEMDVGTHVHYDEYNSLEEGSAQLIVEKVE